MPFRHIKAMNNQKHEEIPSYSKKFKYFIFMILHSILESTYTHHQLPVP